MPGVANPTESLPLWIEIAIINSGPVVWNLVISKSMYTPLPTWISVPSCTLNIIIITESISIKHVCRRPKVVIIRISVGFSVPMSRGFRNNFHVSLKGMAIGIEMTIICSHRLTMSRTWLQEKGFDLSLKLQNINADLLCSYDNRSDTLTISL